MQGATHHEASMPATVSATEGRARPHQEENDMKATSFLLLSTMAVRPAVGAVDTATAQGMRDGMMMRSGTDQQTGRGTMHGGSSATEPGMRCMMQGDMGSGMGQGMGGDMMQHMGGGMMMGSGMMRGGSSSGMDALFGSRVTRVMNLSLEDVRGYLALRLERLNNKRLKIGDLKSDDGTITADIVTVDNSLVQRLKVDRHTGAIQYEN
jgi:hypothetical protein